MVKTHAFTAEGTDSILVRQLRPHRLHSTAKKKKRIRRTDLVHLRSSRDLVKMQILGYRISLFIPLNISCHSLLTCRVSVEKSADNLMGVPLHVICHFSLVAFNIFP